MKPWIRALIIIFGSLGVGFAIGDYIPEYFILVGIIMILIGILAESDNKFKEENLIDLDENEN